MFSVFFILIGTLFLLGAIDDAFIDFVHGLFHLGPRKLSAKEWQTWRALPEQRLAIMIPAWQEAGVLESMVRTNLVRVRYREYKWFIGVYPNDPATLKIAERLQCEFPEKVDVVITDRPGPTSKAHCLNCILERIKESNFDPECVAIHDAEDVIHPDAFTAVNAWDGRPDFLQIPIFSLPVPVREWVSGTYLDEFAEIHLKEIPVRKRLGMPIPSAGVGTFLSWTCLQAVGLRYGYYFDESNLTEDYEISLRVARMGGTQDFMLLRDERGGIVATREYFPCEFVRSIRQKTRWTTGIALQTTAKWKDFGCFQEGVFKQRNFQTLYGLFRDRKSLWSNPSVLCAWAFIPFGLANAPDLGGAAWLIPLNLGLFGLRILQRVRFCKSVYGWKHGVLAAPRVLLSNLINSAACVKAIFQFFRTPKDATVRRIEWDKTEHRFPDLLKEEKSDIQGAA